MKTLYRVTWVIIMSCCALNSYALEVNTSPFLSAVSGFKFNTLNVLINKGSGNMKWGPSIGLGKVSDTSITFLGARVEYSKVKVLYVASGVSVGFLTQEGSPTLTVIPLTYLMGGGRIQYSNYVIKAGIGLTTPNFFKVIEGSSSINDEQSMSNIGPAFELKIGYSF